MFELFVAIGLILLNGAFALSELAIVSSRKPRLRALADEGKPGAAQSLALAENPGRFLSTVQIGITLVGILAGVFSGAALSERFGDILQGWGLPKNFAEPIAYVLVIGAITYLSVIIGELVPKQIALRNPERIACAIAGPMSLVSKLAAPLIWLLDASTKLVFKVFRVDTSPESVVTEQDIRSVVAEAETAGVIESEEKQMIAGVLRLGDRGVRAVMTPRSQVEWIDLGDTEDEIRERLMTTRYSRLPVTEEDDPDNPLGVIQTRELLAAVLKNEPLDIRKLLRKAPAVPDTIDALEALDVLRRAGVPMALVLDEFGHFEGIVTPADILDAIAGAFRSDQHGVRDAVQREDGSWLLSGTLPVDEMAEYLRVSLTDDREYDTVAGFVIYEMGRLPEVAESVEALGWRFEVVDLDGRRVDKVLASRVGM